MADLKIAYETPIKCNLKDLNDFQGSLKELPEAALAQLSKEILDTGFAFAPHIWANPKDKKLYILDGHQRIHALKKLVSEGHKIGKIPVIPVLAKSFKEAKRRVLQGASQYGDVTAEGLFKFMKENSFSFDEIKMSFDFPEINLSKFQEGFFGADKDIKKTANGSIEISEGEFTKLVHTCPECGHKFARES